MDLFGVEGLGHDRKLAGHLGLTANAVDVEHRVAEGFLALLMQGAEADEAIRIGRIAAGR